MISVVIPCYNCASFVKRAIKSVLNQTTQDYELLLIDNRSTDGTLHILNHYKEQFPEKIRVYHEYKRGAPAARNKGLFEAAGEWVQFLDADDELLPDKLSGQLSLARGSGVGLVAGNYVVETIKGRKKQLTERRVAQSAWEGLITSNLGITSSNLWKKQVLWEAGGWDEEATSSQEYELMFRLLRNGTEVLFDDAFLTIVRRRADSISRSADKKRLKDIVQNRISLRNEIKAYLDSTGCLTRKLNRLIDTYVYFELKQNADKIPDYSHKLLKETKLEVPLGFAVKLNTRLVAKKILNI